jgi:hypothetical protein
MRDGKHAVPYRKFGGVRSYCIHDARHFCAGREWKRRLDLILALDLQNVEEIQAGGMIADAHFARSRRGQGDIFQGHCLRFAPGMYAPGFHGRQVLAFGPNSAGSIRYTPSAQAQSSGRVSRGSMISSIPKASAVRSGERKR